MSFNNIIGQDNVVRSILRIIEKKETTSSYIFLGPDGVGKRTVALEFAKAVNCLDNEPGPCDTCVSCKKIIGLNHPDIFNIYPEGASSSIKIDAIRDIIYQASLKPYEARKKIFIINDAHKATEEAQNAFLKILEEPPENHILILTSSNIAGMLPTVYSRCKIIKFSMIKKELIEEFLKKHGIEENKAVLFSHMSLGSIGRALYFNEKDIISKRDQVVNDFFLKKSAMLREDLLSMENRSDIEERLSILLSWYRDILVSKFGPHKDNVFNVDRFKEIASYAGNFTEEKLQKDIQKIIDTIFYIRNNVNAKTALFSMAVELKRHLN